MTPEQKNILGAKRSKVTHLIRYEMRLRGYTCRSLARHIGCSSPSVSRVISGNGHSAKVLDALLCIGIPEELLFDPRFVLTQTVFSKE